MNLDCIKELVKTNKTLSSFLTPQAIGQLKRYLVTGFSSAAIEFILLYILRDLLRANLILANSVALTIVFWFNFCMNRFWSFKSTVDIKKQLVMYAFLFVFNLGASDLIMYLLASKLSLHYMIAKVFALGIIVSWNFVLYKKVIYKS